jgi:Cullin binding/UBA-like domain
MSSGDSAAQFMSITGCNDQLAKTILRQANGNLNVALNNYYASNPQAAAKNRFFNEISGNKEILSDLNLSNLAQSIGVDLSDPFWLVIAAHCECKTMGVFTMPEWTMGMRSLNINNMKELKESVKRIKADLLKKSDTTKKVYKFAFSYSLDDGMRVLKREDAVFLWRLLLGPLSWELLDDWIAFVESKEKMNVVNRDTWNMIWDLATTTKPDLSDFSQEIAWPVAIDEFVEFKKEGMNIS